MSSPTTRHSPPSTQLKLWIAGARGSIATTLAVGVLAACAGAATFAAQSWRVGGVDAVIAALVGGSVDGALVSPDFVNRIVATGCCRALADLSELPMDFARYGIVAPTAAPRSWPSTE